jgi:transcriptional regulator with XRE-family HTH domain
LEVVSIVLSRQFLRTELSGSSKSWSGVFASRLSNSIGVKQAKIAVTYRFAEPGQPPPLMLPQSYSTGKVVRIPIEPKTIGDHIRKRRLELKLLQKNVAKHLGVCQPCAYNWESNTSQPDIAYMPAVIRFLGYNPLPSVEGLGAQLVQRRTALGLTQKELARRLGVDPSTLARWERGE